MARFIANGYIIDGVSPMWPGTIAITDPGKVKEAVSSLKNQGADFLKVYSSIQPDIFRAIMAEAHLQNIPVDGHIPMMVDPIEAASFGMRTSEHMIGMTIGCSKDIDKVREKIQNYEKNGWGEFPQSFINFIKLRQQMARTADKERCNKVIDAYLEHQLVMTPTLINQLTWLDNNEQVKLTSDESVMSLLPESVRKDWVLMANRPPLIKEIVDYPFNVFELAAKRNVKMLAGTDIGNLFLVPGYSLLSEMILMTEQGATNLQVLQSATINPAEVFGFDSLGLIKAGYFADLVLLDANPLDDMNNIKQVNSVVRNGRYLSSKDLYALKLKAKNWKPESNQD
ncbi:MAG: amidohydrolase family protein [Gammaproteobacteria bacterium]|nr:amidohydrolase family protein [Gammaproteobacteria bacterium]